MFSWRKVDDEAERARRARMNAYYSSQESDWRRRQEEIANLDAIIARPMPERPDRLARRLGLIDEVAW